ncbi:hypothetical protein Tco_0459550, partial [Tanacetum coccineum]
MAEQQIMKYSPQWTDMTVDNVIFQTNNVVGNFNYPPNVPAYKLIMKFLRNCSLYNAFTNCPSVVYQNFLREFWSTNVAFDPFPSTDEPEKCPLKEFLIKFLVSNGQRPLTLDFKTFCSSSGLDYNNGKYVDHPTPEVVKKELGKISINPSYLDKTPVLKNSFPVAWRILFSFVIQVLGGNYSYTEQVNSIQQLLAYSLITRTEGPETSGALSKKRKQPTKRPPTETKESPPKLTKVFEQSHSVSSGTVPDPQDLKRIIQLASTGLPSTLNEGTRPSKPLPEGTATHPKDSGGNKQPLYRDITSTTSNEGTDKTTPCLEGLLGDKDLGGNIPPADIEPIHNPVADLSGTEAAVSYADLKASVNQYYDENIAQRDQTDKLVDASMSSLYRSSTTISDLYKGLNIVTQFLKEISNAGFDFSALLSTVKSIQDHVVKQDEASAAWIKTSTNMAWNLGSRMSRVELSQTALKREISSLRKDTSEIKSMMTEMYAAFQGHSSSDSLGSVTQTLVLTDIQANVDRENANTTATEEPHSHTKGETKEPRLEILISSIISTVIPPTQAQPITSIIIHPESSQATPKIDKGKGIATESSDDPSKKLVKVSSIVRPDPDEPVRVEFIINGRKVYLSKQEIQDYWDKEEQIKKAEEEARLNAISKPEVIKVVCEEAKKLGIHPKEAITTKAGELFKKAQDAEHKVLKKQHTEKVRKSLELRKHKYDSYMWTVSSRLKPEPITDIKIHPKTKPMVITVYRGTDGRNFDVHKPFLFGAFGISELDELKEIIPKKKNTVVKDLMNSLSRRYERLRQIPGELGIQSALPAPEQTPSQVSGRKRKHMELEPETRIPGLECNRALPENVPFI